MSDVKTNSQLYINTFFAGLFMPWAATVSGSPEPLRYLENGTTLLLLAGTLLLFAVLNLGMAGAATVTLRMLRNSRLPVRLLPTLCGYGLATWFFYVTARENDPRNILSWIVFPWITALLILAFAGILRFFDKKKSPQRMKSAYGDFSLKTPINIRRFSAPAAIRHRP